MAGEAHARRSRIVTPKPDCPPIVHIVKPGDTPWDIAKRYADGDPRPVVRGILRLNNRTDRPVIHPGEKLKVPKRC